METKGVFFDLYGTLLIYGDMSVAWTDWLSTFYECFKEYGLSISKESFALRCDNFFGKPAPNSKDDKLTAYEHRIHALSLDLRLSLDTEGIKRTANTCANVWQEHISLDPDTLPLLKTLKPKKKLALISNFDHPPHIYSLLSKFNIEKYFDTVIISGAVGVRKPDPQIFTLALEQTGLHPDEVMHVGDSLEDIQGASNAGVLPVLIKRTKPKGKKIFSASKQYQQPSQSELNNLEIRGLKTISRLSELIEI